ncbi:MAG: rod shape-determining protein, partial [Armatimonadetes bacterium]|nr:rod shape-determining protein [Armatimonadota bacterium]
KSVAAGIGAGIALSAQESTLVIDVGAGVTEVAVVALGMATVVRSVPFGGVDVDEAIRKFIWRRAGITLSRAAAEDLKLRVRAVEPALAGNDLDLSEIGPPSVDTRIDAAEVALVMAEALEPLIDEVAWVVEHLAPKQRAEISQNGGVLTGGGALLQGLPQLLEARIGVPLRVAEDPLAATVLGLRAIAGDLKHIPLDGELRVHLGIHGRTV